MLISSPCTIICCLRPWHTRRKARRTADVLVYEENREDRCKRGKIKPKGLFAFEGVVVGAY